MRTSDGPTCCAGKEGECSTSGDDKAGEHGRELNTRRFGIFGDDGRDEVKLARRLLSDNRREKRSSRPSPSVLDLATSRQDERPTASLNGKSPHVVWDLLLRVGR